MRTLLTTGTAPCPHITLATPRSRRAPPVPPGTRSGALTPVPVDLRETAALHSAYQVFTAEASSNLKVVGGPWPLSPVSTLFAWQFAPDECIVVPAGKYLNIVCNFPGANQDVEASATVKE